MIFIEGMTTINRLRRMRQEVPKSLLKLLKEENSNKNLTSGTSKANSFNPFKGINPHTKYTTLKCYECNEEDHKPMSVQMRKTINLVEREKEIYCEIEETRMRMMDFN